jgi:hypothetical protein
VVERKNRTFIEMARTMLDEYKIQDIFWAEAINTVCHAINRLYLHKFHKKTSYELITSKNPKVSYFRVFGCKCFILNKRPRTSKFAPKVDEGFLLGYGPNEHAYQVFNLTTGRIEVMLDLTFDESNGSQVEQVDLNVVGNEKSSCEVIKQLAIGDVRPVEAQEEDEEQLKASTPLEGPKVTGSVEEQTPEVPRNSPEVLENVAGTQPPGKSPEVPGSGSSAIKTLRTSKKISKGMLKQVHMNLKLMKMMKTNLYTNLLDHLTPVYIKSYNGITSLTISLGA